MPAGTDSATVSDGVGAEAGAGADTDTGANNFIMIKKRRGGRMDGRKTKKKKKGLAKYRCELCVVEDEREPPQRSKPELYRARLKADGQ